MAPPSAVTAEDRIISHMNADHHDSLVRYLEHLHSVPSSTARHAKLTAITCNHLAISTVPQTSNSKDDGKYIIPLEPPLKDLGQARERLVAMDHEAIKALDRSDITLKQYIFPNTPIQIFTVCTTVSVLLLFSSRRNLDPSNPNALFAPLASRFPNLFGLMARLQFRVFWSIWLIHVAECMQLARTRLRRHSVPRGSRVWWAWMASNLIEGFSAPLRIDAFVRRQKAAKEAKKH